MATHIYKAINGLDTITSTDKKVKVSSDDTNPSYLDNKLTVGSTKLTKTINNNGADENIELDVDETVITHNNLTGLTTGDPHTQYPLGAGKGSGQTLTGGANALGNLTLRSTSNATKGSVIVDETTESTTKDTGALVVEGGVGIEKSLNVGGTIKQNSVAVVDLSSAQTLTNKTLTSPVLNTGVSGTAVLDEDDMSSDSATQIPTQQSVKAYVDGKFSPGDILETDFATTNNQVVAADVTGFAFADASVRSFKAHVSVYIDANPDLWEEFEMEGTQTAAGGWIMSYSSIGDASGISFDISATGQITYTSTSIVDFVSGSIKFRAITTSV